MPGSFRQNVPALAAKAGNFLRAPRQNKNSQYKYYKMVSRNNLPVVEILLSAII